MNQALIIELVEKLYKDVVGYNISFAGRKKLGYHDSSYTYGEIVPAKFIEILESVRPKKGEVFYDLGSGTGKAVVVAALAYEFSKAVGVEYLADLHEASNGIKTKLEHELEGAYKALANDNDIQFLNTDFLTLDLNEADIVYAHATCFHDGIMNMLTPKLERLKKGARVLLVSKQIHSPLLTQIVVKDYPFNWGQATVYTYLKNS